MSDSAAGAKSLLSSLRATLAVSGVVMLVVGLLVLIWPEKSAIVVTWILAVYFLVLGLVYIGLGIFAKAKGGWARVGHIVLGLIYVIAAIVMFANLQLATAVLAVFIGVLVGIMWIIDGIVSLSLIGQDGSKVWTVLYAILSVIAGIVLLTSPMWGAVILWLLVGISLVVLGVVQIVRAITLGKEAKALGV